MMLLRNIVNKLSPLLLFTVDLYPRILFIYVVTKTLDLSKQSSRLFLRDKFFTCTIDKIGSCDHTIQKKSQCGLKLWVCDDKGEKLQWRYMINFITNRSKCALMIQKMCSRLIAKAMNQIVGQIFFSWAHTVLKTTQLQHSYQWKNELQTKLFFTKRLAQ